MKKILLASAFIASAFIGSATAAEPGFEGYGSWDRGEARAELNNTTPEWFMSSSTGNAYYGCGFTLSSTEPNNTVSKWYFVESFADFDTKLYYKNPVTSKWEYVSDDQGEGTNFAAMIYVPAGRAHDLKLMAGYFSTGRKDAYHFSASKFERNPQYGTTIARYTLNADGSLTSY